MKTDRIQFVPNRWLTRSSLLTIGPRWDKRVARTPRTARLFLTGTTQCRGTPRAVCIPDVLRVALFCSFWVGRRRRLTNNSDHLDEPRARNALKVYRLFFCSFSIKIYYHFVERVFFLFKLTTCLLFHNAPPTISIYYWSAFHRNPICWFPLFRGIPIAPVTKYVN